MFEQGIFMEFSGDLEWYWVSISHLLFAYDTLVFCEAMLGYLFYFYVLNDYPM